MVYVERDMHEVYGHDPRVIRSVLVARGKAIYPQFAPDGQYHEPDAGIEAIIIAAAAGDYGPEYALDPYGVTVQMSEETAACQSHYWLTRANPGGIGAEDQNPDLAIDFTKNADGSPRSRAEAMRAGLDAMCNHERDYRFGRGPWTAKDPRAKNMPESYFGRCHTWASLTGFWATSPTYAQSMEGIWQQLVRIAGDAVVTPLPTGGRVPKPPVVTKYRSPNRDYSTPFLAMGIVNHIATSNLSSNISWFMNPAADASANFEIAKDGTIVEFVEFPHSAYANGVVNAPDRSHPLVAAILAEGVNFNTRTYSIEHEGEAGDRLTPAQITSNNWLTAWLAQEGQFPIDADHIIGHSRIDSVNRPYCPSFDPDEWDKLIGGAQTVRDHYKGGVMPNTNVRTFADVGLPWELRGGFKDLWEHAEQSGLNLVLIGFPASNEFDVNPPEAPRSGLHYRLASIAKAVKVDRGGYMVWEPGEGAPWNFRLAQPDQERLLDDLFAQLFPDVQAAA